MDPYDVLGVAPDATEDEIRAAYKRLAQRHHPDKGGRPERMAEINDAYEAITQPDKNAGPDVETIARQRILTLFLETANKEQWRQADYIAALHRGINQGEDELIKREAALIGIRDRMDAMIPNHPDAEENMFAIAIRGEQKKIDGDLETITRELEIMRMSRELLEPYDDNLPPQEFATQFFFTNSTSSSTGSW